jgi:hypothetical protein
VILRGACPRKRAPRIAPAWAIAGVPRSATAPGVALALATRRLPHRRFPVPCDSTLAEGVDVGYRALVLAPDRNSRGLVDPERWYPCNAEAGQALATSDRPRVSVPIECQNSKQERRNGRQSPARRRHRYGRYPGIKRGDRTFRFCVPCRRSWVRVPSAASRKSPRALGFRAFQLAPRIGLGAHFSARGTRSPRAIAWPAAGS